DKAELSGSDLQLKRTIEVEGTIEGEVNTRRGRLVALEGEVKTVQKVQDKAFAATETEVKVELVEETTNHQDRQELEEQRSKLARLTAAISLYTPEDAKVAETMIQRNELGKNTLEGLMTKLDDAESISTEASDERVGTQNELNRKFRALIYLY